MSELNGDKARFQLQRRAGLRRRTRARATLAVARVAATLPAGSNGGVPGIDRTEEGRLRLIRGGLAE